MNIVVKTLITVSKKNNFYHLLVNNLNQDKIISNIKDNLNKTSTNNYYTPYLILDYLVHNISMNPKLKDILLNDKIKTEFNKTLITYLKNDIKEFFIKQNNILHKFLYLMHKNYHINTFDQYHNYIINKGVSIINYLHPFSYNIKIHSQDYIDYLEAYKTFMLFIRSKLI